MRIGVLTFTLQYNYGCMLQAWALQTVLKRMGHDVWLIQKLRPKKKLPLWRAPLSYSKRILQNLIGHRRRIFEEQYQNECIYKMLTAARNFSNDNIRIKNYKEYSDIRPDEYDAIIVGSDQIWRPIFFEGDIRDAFLQFANGWKIKRLSYAASFGTDDIKWPDDLEKDCKQLLGEFDAVSVREKSGVDICKKHFNINAAHVLDPTMLLSADDYVRLIKKAKAPKSPGTLHYYILDETPEKLQLVKEIAQKKGLTPFRVNSRVEDPSAPIEERIQPPVEKWLRAFYDADFVVTDSFHACVFSIIFNKQFIVYGNKERGLTRFKSLLSDFGLEDRLVYNFSDFGQLTNINYGNVNTLLEKRKNFSYGFLKKEL